MNTAKKLGMIFTVIFICAVVTACSTVGSTVVAESRNKYTVVASGKSTDIALHNAYKNAEKVCATQRKKTVVILNKTIKYEGIRRDLSATNKKIADIAAATGEVMNFPKLDKDDDYESTMVFECQGSTITRCNYCFPVAKSHRENNGYHI
jgi:hypothetical protein